jgi:hypothetical protein
MGRRSRAHETNTPSLVVSALTGRQRETGTAQRLLENTLGEIMKTKAFLD